MGHRAEPVYLPPEAACPESESELSLGARLVEAREQRGLTAKQVASEIRVPASYVDMMETGNYGAIPDQLYLLPSFRRYAEFLGLDVAEVTASFMLDFEAEENAVVIPGGDPRTIARKPLPTRWIAKAAAVIGATASIAAVAVFVVRHAPSPRLAAVQAATSPPAPAAPVAATAASVAPVAQFAQVSSVVPVTAPAATAPLAPLAPLTHLAEVPPAAVVGPIAMTPPPAHPAATRSTASNATAKAGSSSHRRLASLWRHRHFLRKHHVVR
ncbi:MAG TPA: helix-turn-helix domain-containing protein [Candidatus Acidoferrales bacterium]|nr:helix-turn-helix domain-containing protein [Candidatus Acidoferrales bacterium]